MLKQNFCFLFFILFASLFSCHGKEKQTYTGLYDLHFRMSKDSAATAFYPWRTNAAYTTNAFYPASRKDSIYTISYDSRISLSERLELELEQQIVLPLHSARSGKVIFEGRGKELKEIYLVVVGLDYQEKNLFSDTIGLQLDPDLKTFSKEILLKDVELLNLKFYIKGEEKANASVGFSKVNILIGDKPIDEFPLRRLCLESNSVKYMPIDLNSNKFFRDLDIGRGKKIIGLGESLHRNTCINNLAYRFMQEEIATGSCKLVLLERQMEKFLIYDYYIKGGDVEIEYPEEPDFRTFIGFLKEYNQDKEESEKVTLGGIDYNYLLNRENNSFDDIFNYIIALNNNLKNRELDLLALSLAEEDGDKTISLLHEKREELEPLLPVGDYKSIVHILNLSHTIGDNMIDRVSVRDSIMYLNTKHLVQNFCPGNSTAVIYAHTGHLNPVSAYPSVPSRPLGSYLKEDYSENYSPLLVLIGQGSVLFTQQMAGEMTSKEIALPIEGSMEQILDSTGEDALFLSVTSEYDRLLYSRYLAAYSYPAEFFPYNIFQRCDGIFFIKECTDTVTYKYPSTDLMSEMNKAMITRDKAKMDEISKYLRDNLEQRQMKSENIRKKRREHIEEIRKRIKEDEYTSSK